MRMDLAKLARETVNVFEFVVKYQRPRQHTQNGGARELARVWWWYRNRQRKGK